MLEKVIKETQRRNRAKASFIGPRSSIAPIRLGSNSGFLVWIVPVSIIAWIMSIAAWTKRQSGAAIMRLRASGMIAD
jgi:hypothetical protein